MAEEMQDIIDKETMQLAGGPEALQSPPTIEELLQTHLLHRRKFEDSEEWTSLKTYLRAEQERGVKITKLVGLGMGSCQNNTYGSVWAQSLQKETALLSALMVFLSELYSCHGVQQISKFAGIRHQGLRISRSCVRRHRQSFRRTTGPRSSR